MKTMDATTKTGNCSTCGALRPLRADRTLIAHDRVIAVRGWRRRWAACDGAGSPARAVPGVSGEAS